MQFNRINLEFKKIKIRKILQKFINKKKLV